MSKMKNAPYQNPNLSIKERVDDLLSRMTIDEKIGQIQCIMAIGGEVPNLAEMTPNGIGQIAMMGGGRTAYENEQFTTAIQKYMTEETELGIPAIIHAEALSGGVFADATIFPVAIGLGSTWDSEKIQLMGDVIRKQMRAVGLSQALSPVMDNARDPRWGRIGETYGEDPTLISALSTAFVKGVQGEDLSKGVATTAKHFIGYGLSEAALNMTTSHITERELREVHAKPFQAAITDANIISIMNSYGAIDGEPVISSTKILTNLLRDEMGFEGITVSDYMSIDRCVVPYATAKNIDEAGVQALRAGMDMELPNSNGYSSELREAIKRGELEIDVLNIAVRRVLETKFRLGLFENPYPLAHEIPDVYKQQKDETLSKKLAEESIILLKNENMTLPLKKDKKKIAVIGPHADSMRALFGAYTLPAMFEMFANQSASAMAGVDQKAEEVGIAVNNEPGVFKEEAPMLNDMLKGMYPDTLTIFEAIQKLAPESIVTTAHGCTYAGKDKSGFDEALKLVAQADVTILTLGGKNGWGSTCTIGEGIDSMSIDLPGVQEDLARAIAEISKNVIIVHMDGRPLSNEFVAETFPAVLEAWQPGMFGGEAIASVLFGDANPGGKLPVTVAKNAGQIPIYYSAKKGSGYAGQIGFVINKNGYADGTSKPLFYFGHGLSYTNFKYSDLRLSSKEVDANGEISVSITIENSGNIAGDEVVQLYVKDIQASMVRPVKELVGFKRINLQAGEKRIVTFTYKLSQMAFLDTDMKWKVEAGEMEVQLGASSDDIRQTDKFTIINDTYIDGRTRTFVSKVSID